MSSKKLLFYAYSDVHHNVWATHNDMGKRTLAVIEFVKKLEKKAAKEEVPLLFAGDFVHKPKAISNRLFGLLTKYVMQSPAKVIGITGNHDQSEQNNAEHHSPSFWSSFCSLNPKWVNLDWSCYDSGRFKVWGIPFISGNRDYDRIMAMLNEEAAECKKTSVLLIHTDLPGAQTPSGFVVDDHDNIPDNLDSIFSNFDLVLAGHIHRPAKITRKVYMLGAPYHQETSDEGCEMGYWACYKKGKTLSLEFTPSGLPEFKTLAADVDPPDDYHLYLRANIDTPEEGGEDNSEFSQLHDRKALAKSYIHRKGITDKQKLKALLGLLSRV